MNCHCCRVNVEQEWTDSTGHVTVTAPSLALCLHDVSSYWQLFIWAATATGSMMNTDALAGLIGCTCHCRKLLSLIFKWMQQLLAAPDISCTVAGINAEQEWIRRPEEIWHWRQFCSVLKWTMQYSYRQLHISAATAARVPVVKRNALVGLEIITPHCRGQRLWLNECGSYIPAAPDLLPCYVWCLPVYVHVLLNSTKKEGGGSFGIRSFPCLTYLYHSRFPMYAWSFPCVVVFLPCWFPIAGQWDHFYFSSFFFLFFFFFLSFFVIFFVLCR